MAHIVFFEPSYVASQPQVWGLRGGHKYPSILGDLPTRARVTIAMAALPPADDPHRRALEAQGIAFHHLDLLDEPRVFRSADFAEEIERELRALGADLASSMNGRIMGYNYAVARAATEAGVRYVYRVAGNDIETRGEVIEARGVPFWGTSHHANLVAQERYALAAADRIIVMTRKEERRVARLCGDAGRITICFRGADERHFTPAPERAETCRRFLYVGRRSYEKGYDRLEEASDHLAAAGADVSFTIAGSFTPGEQGNRRYLGFVTYDGLPEVYRGSDALIVCSRSEGFPQVIMEAMTAGLPCILSRALFEADFTHEEDCLLVDGDPESVAAAVMRLRSEPGTYRRLRDAALARARRDFSEAANQARYHGVLLGGGA